MNPRIVLVFGVLSVLVPPVGIPCLVVYVAAKVLDHASRDEGLVTRRRVDALLREEPWVTGDEEADQRTLDAMIAAKEARR